MLFFFDPLIIDLNSVVLLLGLIWVASWSYASHCVIRKFYKTRISPEHNLSDMNLIENKYRKWKLYTLNTCIGIFYMMLVTSIFRMDNQSTIVLITSIFITTPTIYLLWYSIFKDSVVLTLCAISLISFTIASDTYLYTQVHSDLYHELIMLKIVVKCFFVGFVLLSFCALCCI